MAASDATVEAIIKVLFRHITRDKARAIARDLKTVPGNKSFTVTVERLSQRLEEIG